MNYVDFLKERALVDERIDNLLKLDEFSLTTRFLCSLHGYLFKGIYADSGKIRTYNLRKTEIILNGDTVEYADYHGIRTLLNMAFDEERMINYNNLTDTEKVENVAKFCLKIWQIHPFCEGNTRLIKVYIEKYLKYLGFNVDNTFLRDNAAYFRESLVRGAYYNYKYGIMADDHYLTLLFKKMVLDDTIELDDIDLNIEHLFTDNTNVKRKK